MSPRQRLAASADEATEASTQSVGSIESKDSCDSLETPVPSDSDVARDRHDLFNLVALVPMVAFMVINWDFGKFMGGHGAEASWSGEYFMLMWSATIAYFFADLLWVARVPICVKSPGVIIKHHIGAMVYLWGPVMWPQFQWFMGVILSVEINTWFLIARRVLYKRKGSTPQILSDLITLAFYVSWIVIRCIVFPLVLMIMLSKARDKIIETGHVVHAPIAFIPLHAFFCLLNLKWSYELFKPIIKKWWNHEDAAVKVASGL